MLLTHSCFRAMSWLKDTGEVFVLMVPVHRTCNEPSAMGLREGLSLSVSQEFVAGTVS